MRRYGAQKQMIQRTEEFIRKNIAGTNSKNARGRQKQLDRMERIAAPTFLSKAKICFKELGMTVHKALSVEQLVVGYQNPLLPELNFVVYGGEKMVVTGFNGMGKSPLESNSNDTARLS